MTATTAVTGKLQLLRPGAGRSITTVQCRDRNRTEDRQLEHAQALDRFLAGVERRALRMAELAVGNREDALDLVQEAMLGLVSRYRHKREDEWGALFHRILQSRIRDWYRRSRVRNRLFGWLGHRDDDEDAEADPIQSVADPAAPEPSRLVGNAAAIQQLDAALQALPLRQQQAFLLRCWEGLDVAETAFAMGCSAGSVKTHYSRALQKLREQLEEHWS